VILKGIEKIAVQKTRNISMKLVAYCSIFVIVNNYIGREAAK